MKISDIRLHHLHATPPMGTKAGHDAAYSTLIIEILTDDGLTGIAEVDSVPEIISAIIKAPRRTPLMGGLREILIGRDPLDIPGAFAAMMAGTAFIGRRGIVMHAISGIDLALWDLKGKAENRSIATMLGGQQHTTLPYYITVYPLGYTRDDAARALEHALTTYAPSGIKIAADRFWQEEPDRAAMLLQTARATIGPDMPLMLDAITAFDTFADIERLHPVLEALDLTWLEAPLPLTNMADHEKLPQLDIPIGIGDLGLTAPEEWLPWFATGAVTIAQPELSYIGGLTGYRQLDVIAKAHQCTRIAPHGWNTMLTLGLNAQVLASRPNPDMIEFSTSASPLRWLMTREDITPHADGTITVPNRPGLGLTLDMSRMAPFRIA